MSGRLVTYRCPFHGDFTSTIRCGFGHGPAPTQLQCIAPGCSRTGKRKNRVRGHQRTVTVTAEAYDRLKRHCDQQGISMQQWIEAHTQDIGGGP